MANERFIDGARLSLAKLLFDIYVNGERGSTSNRIKKTLKLNGFKIKSLGDFVNPTLIDNTTGLEVKDVD